MALWKAVVVQTRSDFRPLDFQLEVNQWEFLQANDFSMARQMLVEHTIKVGLVVWHWETPNAMSGWIQQISDDLFHPCLPVQWIALIQPHHIEYPEIREFIAHHFFDFHTLPLDVSRLRVILGHAQGMARLISTDSRPRGIQRRSAVPREVRDEGNDCCGMIGTSSAMKTLLSHVRKAARTSAPVLIRGETGTGKELVALAIHKHTNRAQGPFIAVNCGALPPNLIQAELFGYEKGAFTGAQKRKPGRIELAEGGTLFLDEIGDLPADLQVNLLRFLEEMTINRIGGTTTIPVDVRVISATHINLEEAVQAGRFRQDLYFRLNVLELETPPLRQRGEDIVSIAEHYLAKYFREAGVGHKRFSNCALDAMRFYHWPGNVRELRNRVRRATIMSEGSIIRAIDLGLVFDPTETEFLTLEEARARAERQLIKEVLHCSAYNITRAAFILGTSRRSLYRLIERHGLRKYPGELHIDKNDFKPSILVDKSNSAR